MKKNYIKICTVLAGLSLVACLDDDKYALDPDGTHNVIEFIDPSVPNSPAGAIYPLWTTVTELQPNFTFQQTISYSGPNSNDSNIELVVEVDPTALQDYNQQMTDDLHDATYEMMPANYYTFTPTTVTIPKGSNKVDFDILVHPDQFDLSRTFALPLRITSASKGVLSAHYSTAMFVVVVKNLYDGIYHVMGGDIQRNSATGPDPALSGNFVITDDLIFIPFVTINGNTTAFQPTWKDGSGIAGIDGTRVLVDEVNPYVAPPGFTAPANARPATVTSATNPVLQNTGGRLNYYTPDDGTGQELFILNFNWGAGANTRVITDMKPVYDSPR